MALRSHAAICRVRTRSVGERPAPNKGLGVPCRQHGRGTGSGALVSAAPCGWVGRRNRLPCATVAHRRGGSMPVSRVDTTGGLEALGCAQLLPREKQHVSPRRHGGPPASTASRASGQCKATCGDESGYTRMGSRHDERPSPRRHGGTEDGDGGRMVNGTANGLCHREHRTFRGHFLISRPGSCAASSSAPRPTARASLSMGA